MPTRSAGETLMVRYAARRFVQAIPVVFLSTIAVFALVRVLPGDTAQVLAGPDGRPDVIAAIRADLHLDDPLPVQYVVWIARVLRFDLGASPVSHRPVAELISLRAPATMELAVAAVFLELTIALSSGILAAVNRGRRIDWAISLWNGIAVAIPSFWLAILSIILFAVTLRWLPAGGYVAITTDPARGLQSLLLPAVTLALPGSAALSRIVRNSMLDVLGEDFIRTARSKGLRARTIVVRHALRNALMPVATVLGLQFGRLLGGAVIIESVFTWPGIGRLIIDAIDSRDYVVVQGTLLVFVVAFIAVTLITDISYGVLDPRVS